jgi:uncharacterized membrane protein YkoI
MKNKLFRQLSVLALSLAFVLVLSACVPDIHIHTGGNENENTATQSENAITSTDNDLVVSTDDKSDSKPQEKPATQVASSEKQSSSKKEDSTASKNQNNTTASKPTTNAKITKDEAKKIAFKDAGVKENEIYDFEIELDRDNGVLHYDISFEKDGKDYDYEINAKTGKIISVEKPKATASKSQISKSKAKSVALKHAGVTEKEISRFESELEKDDGVWKYEISFDVGSTEYDYTINAENGKILESEKDIDD